MNAEPSRTVAGGAVATFALLAATTLSLALYDHGGTFSEAAIRWLLVSVGSLLIALLSLHRASSSGARGLRVVAVLCLGVQFAALLWSPIGYPMRNLGVPEIRALTMVLGLSAVLAGSLCAERPWLGRATFPLLVLAQAGIVLAFLHLLVMPGIDTLMFQREACSALEHGIDPYSLLYRDPYTAANSARFYGPGVSVGGVLQFGYPYMPVLLLLSVPGHLAGDVRYGGLACVIAAAFLIAAARETPLARIAGVLFLFSPIASLVVVAGWSDSYVVFLLAFTVYCRARRPELTPYVFGLLVVCKQYMLPLAPLGLLLLPRPWTWTVIRPFALRAGVTAAVLTLPLVLWDPAGFWRSAIVLQTLQPYRPDALSFLVWAAPANPAAWMWVPFVGLAVAILGSLAVGRRRALPFPLAVAACLVTFFALNKQAFANYYFVVIAALCLSAVDSEPELDRLPGRRSRSRESSASGSSPTSQ